MEKLIVDSIQKSIQNVGLIPMKKLPVQKMGANNLLNSTFN